MSAPPDAPLLFPARPGTAAAVVLAPTPDGVPVLSWLGTLPADARPDSFACDVVTASAGRPGSPLLVEHSRASYRRPGLRGSRLRSGRETGAPPAGRDWSTAFVATGVEAGPTRLAVDAADPAAGLALHTEFEALSGGALRIRSTVTNTGDAPYLVDGLEVGVPVSAGFDELLDFTGRHEHERSPQRHPVRDGLWLRENRRGRTGLESASMLIAGASGFGFGHGDVVGVHLAHSGNSVLWAERDAVGATTLGGGELLLPGEVVLEPGASYTAPWLVVVAGAGGLDSIAAPLHAWLRTLPAHPGEQPVVLNVWEAVYFDHDLARLTDLADRAARVGVERFVLDDGWFHGRRNDRAGLGDWWVDDDVWPHGLQPLVDHVRGLGMQFGLWFEPEMVNPDSELYRDHPQWVLATGSRLPLPERNQQVLDLTNPDVVTYLLDRMGALLNQYRIDFVKWDHNRDLLDAGSGDVAVPATHGQARAHYELLDELRRRHPGVAWESCASGGGRIDLGVLERVQRVWTSDMTDALARQQIQRWTAQFVAPEYLGAHVSAPTSHQTGRTLPLDFRAATALFGSFGVEWDLTRATPADLDQLAGWVQRYKDLRGLLHTGRTFRVDCPEPAVLLHGVVAADGRSALAALVQLDEPSSNRGVVLRVPHLDPQTEYALRWAGPVDDGRVSRMPPLHPDGPTGGVAVCGAVLRDVGVWLPRRRPETVLLIHLEAVADEAGTR